MSNNEIFSHTDTVGRDISITINIWGEVIVTVSDNSIHAYSVEIPRDKLPQLIEALQNVPEPS